MIRSDEGLYVQGLGPPRGVGRATDVVVGGITPVLVDSPRRCSRMVERVALQVEDGVETLADSLHVVCGLCCKAFVFRVFPCSIKHYFAYLLCLVYLSFFFHPSLR